MDDAKRDPFSPELQDFERALFIDKSCTKCWGKGYQIVNGTNLACRCVVKNRLKRAARERKKVSAKE